MPIYHSTQLRHYLDDIPEVVRNSQPHHERMQAISRRALRYGQIQQVISLVLQLMKEYEAKGWEEFSAEDVLYASLKLLEFYRIENKQLDDLLASAVEIDPRDLKGYYGIYPGGHEKLLARSPYEAALKLIEKKPEIEPVKTVVIPF